jgi:hypothetical protein
MLRLLEKWNIYFSVQIAETFENFVPSKQRKGSVDIVCARTFADKGFICRARL